MSDNIYIFIIYFIGVSLWATGLTLHDKRAAKHGSWRVKERTLFFVSIIGGSVAMLTIMKIIRHKTKHKRFMIGIPVIIILQIIIMIFVWYQMKDIT